MKKLLLILGILLGTAQLKAAQVDWNIVPTSTYTILDSGGQQFFSSATIQFVAIQLSSAGAGGGNNFITFYRSTSPSFTQDLSTQVSVNLASTGIQLPFTVPLYDITNTSYTYYQKGGTAGITIFFRCLNLSRGGVCPGLRTSGQK